jgi:hypothetical protein
VYNKDLCLHLRGSIGSNGKWELPTGAQQVVVTAPCAGGGDNKATKAIINQVWTWTAPVLTHQVSGLVLAVAPTTAVSDGTYVTVAPAVPGDASQAWNWENFGMITPTMAPQFSLTDGHTIGGVYGVPVHLWQLNASLPTGAPRAEWQQLCAAVPAALLA